jgi:thioredoxin-dependent peroxiredoxin
MKLKKGDKAPDFALPDQDGKTMRLSDFKGKKLLLFFYPKAGTSGWTRQALGVRDAGQHLKELHISVAAISPDGVAAQKKFDENNNLGFPLLSDTEHTASEAYGVWEEKSMYGKTYWGIVRSAFLIECEKLVEIRDPFLFAPNIEGDPEAKVRLSESVKSACLQLLKECEAVIALVDWGDTGVAFEAGYAHSLNVPVLLISVTTCDSANAMLIGAAKARFDNILDDEQVRRLAVMLESLRVHSWRFAATRQ